MVELMIGLVFTLMPILVCLLVNTSGEIEINEEMVAAEEFFSFGGGIELFILFFAVGVFFLIRVISRFVRDKRTDIYGIETFGVLMDIVETNVLINDCPVLAGKFATIINNSVEIVTETLGTDPKWDVGACLIVSYYKNDINVVDEISFEALSNDIQLLLKPYLP